MFARAAVVLLLSVSLVQAQPRPRKVFISVDMEGISGVVQPAQLGRRRVTIVGHPTLAASPLNGERREATHVTIQSASRLKPGRAACSPRRRLGTNRIGLSNRSGAFEV